MKDIIIIPTYNEKENLKVLIPKIFRILPDIWVIIVDDNSPDGTADTVRNLMRTYPHLDLINREKKEGLGKAYTFAFKCILKDIAVNSIIMMDGDLSHDPTSLTEMIRQSEYFDCVVGSRYMGGGRIVEWELWRRLLSLFGNIYCRVITSLPIKDCTGGFNLIRADLLRKIDFDSMDSSGYAFQIELKFMLYKASQKFKEIPIIFRERADGKSKISNHIIREGIIAPWKMIFKRRRL